jgi:hypothetical protein
MTKKLFDLGQTVMTCGVADKVERDARFAAQIPVCIARHASGDWGDMDAEDKRSNDAALEGRDRILSAYDLEGTKVWIITEWDRSVTTILFPDEY